MNKKLNNIFKGDKVIWMVFFFLCLISIVEVYSASSRLTFRGGDYISPIIKHTSILVLGFCCMVVVLQIKCKYFKIVTPFLLIFSILLLIMALTVGHSEGDASRWVGLFGLKFQPSEIAKGTLVLATAQILSAMQTPDGADPQAFKYILAVSGCIVPLILLENFSTAMLISCVIFMMMLIGRVPQQQLGKLLGVGVILAAFFIFCIMMSTANDDNNPNLQLTEQVETNDKKEEKGVFEKVFHRFGTWKNRILKFVDNEEIPPEKVDLNGRGAQTTYANIAIASSKVLGKGPGNSETRDSLYLAFSDFIYAIIIEEMGIIGAAFVALLYIILLFRTGRIANRCANNFPAFLAMGLALLLTTQALFNMCVAVGLAPVTGQPLPLISRGGTSSVINCIYLGVILSISRSAKKKDSNSEELVEAKLVSA